MALYEAFNVINKGKNGEDKKGRIFISKAVILLCQTNHNRDADLLSNFVYDKKYDIDDDEINELFDDIRNESMEMPEYIYDCHTLKGKRSGKTKEDFFIQEQEALMYEQVSLFDVEKMLSR